MWDYAENFFTVDGENGVFNIVFFFNLGPFCNSQATVFCETAIQTTSLTFFSFYHSSYYLCFISFFLTFLIFIPFYPHACPPFLSILCPFSLLSIPSFPFSFFYSYSSYSLSFPTVLFSFLLPSLSTIFHLLLLLFLHSLFPIPFPLLLSSFYRSSARLDYHWLVVEDEGDITKSFIREYQS